MEYKFSIRVDNEQHSLTKENGMPIESLGEVLTTLAKAIKLEESEIVLSEIRGNCYALGFISNDERVYGNFKIVHTNISTRDESELLPSELEYLRAWKKILRNQGVYFEALDSENNRIVKITDFPAIPKVTPVQFTKTVYGTIISFGGRSEDRPQIVVELTNGEKPTIYLSEADEMKILNILPSIYKKRQVKFVLTVRNQSRQDRRTYTLKSFTVARDQSFFDSVSSALEVEGQLFTDVVDAVAAVRKIRNT